MPAKEQLGAHPSDCAGSSVPRSCVDLTGSRKPEVAQKSMLIFGDKHVRRLHVTVNDVLIVKILQALRYFASLKERAAGTRSRSVG